MTKIKIKYIIHVEGSMGPLLTGSGVDAFDASELKGIKLVKVKNPNMAAEKVNRLVNIANATNK